MKPTCSNLPTHERWAQFRFSVIGALLAAPPEHGQLGRLLDQLASKKWRHPIHGQWFRLGRSTIERWYYKALESGNTPVQALRRQIRRDQGTPRSWDPKWTPVLHTQYREHPQWSYQLHADNLAAALEAQEASSSAKPSYASVRRFMKKHGWIKRPRRGPRHRPGAQAAEERFEAREIRGYENPYVNGLWHLDFHHGSKRVLLSQGRWTTPLLLGILDDHSRLCCHLQWYLAEGAQQLCHGLGQAIQKRQLPRSILFDNGPAMTAGETEAGLTNLGVLFENTLPYSPYQNGKQESFWGQIEGRLLPMLEGTEDLSLAQLNEATLAWVEMEYNRSVHGETGQWPLHRYLNDKDVGRPCPSTRDLRLAFTVRVVRQQRRSDGSFSLKGVRFEVPSRYGHFEKLIVRYASWDLGWVHLCDPTTGAVLSRVYPQDKVKNAEGHRAARQTFSSPPPLQPSGDVAPLLKKYIAQYAATGLPPAYLPHDEPSCQS